MLSLTVRKLSLGEWVEEWETGTRKNPGLSNPGHNGSNLKAQYKSHLTFWFL